MKKEFITLDRLQKGLHVEKKDYYFNEKEYDFRPAMLATMRKGLQVVKTDNHFSKKGVWFSYCHISHCTKRTLRQGLHIVKTDNYFSEKEFDFRTATLATERKGHSFHEKDSI